MAPDIPGDGADDESDSHEEDREDSSDSSFEPDGDGSDRNESDNPDSPFEQSDGDGSSDYFMVQTSMGLLRLTRKQIESGELPPQIPPEMAESILTQLKMILERRKKERDFDPSAFRSELEKHLSADELQALLKMMPIQAVHQMKMMVDAGMPMPGLSFGSPGDEPEHAEAVGEETFYRKLKFMATMGMAAEAGRKIEPKDVIESLGNDEKIDALIRFLSHARTDPREEHHERMRLRHNLALARALGELSGRLTEANRILHQCQNGLGVLRTMCNRQDMRERRDAMRTNFHAMVLDSIVMEWDEHLVFMNSFVHEAESFSAGIGSVLDSPESMGGYEMADAVGNAVQGFLQAAKVMKERADQFPARVKELAENLKAYHQDMSYEYCNDDESNRPAHMPRWGSAAMPRDPNGEVPTFNDNLHYTAFLHAIAREIPGGKVPDKKKKGAKEIEYDKLKLSSFRQFLHGQTDGALLMNVTSPAFFVALSHVLSRTHEVYKAYARQYERCDIDGIGSGDPENFGKGVMHRIRRTMDKNAIVSNDAMRNFDPAEVAANLRDLDMSKSPAGQDNESGLELSARKPKTEGQRAWLKLFEKLDEHLRRQATTDEPMSRDEETAFIEELIALKMDTTKKRRIRKNRLKKDRDEDNHAYRIESGGPFSDLRFYPVPVEKASFEDIVGSSWNDVRKRVDQIYDLARRSFVWTTLAPRRKVNTNMILVGPPGMGKDLAVRAIMADPRTVGVHTTYAELVSEFVGRGSKNVMQMMDGAYDLRQEHEKPVVISIDEIDQMFPQGEAGNGDRVKEEMQKALQSALDGYVLRDGVSLVGLTNNPERIPAPMWRRANLHIIEALTAQERRKLLSSLIVGIPQEPEFRYGVAWDRILENSDHASGDVLGLIADETYAEYIRLLDAKAPGRLDDINAQVEEKLLRGETISTKQKVQIFRRGRGKNVHMTAAHFNEIAMRVLEGDNAVSAMSAQEDFYRTVRRKIDEGQSGKVF